MIAISSHLTKRISARLVVLVGELAAGGREQQERQDEQRADHQAGQRRRQPAHLQLVGHHHRERELEQVVVGGAEELGPEERREAALREQRELVRMGVSGGLGRGGGKIGVRGQAELPSRGARGAPAAI